MNKTIWIILLVLTLGISFACTTTKNTGTAIKEGSTEAAEEVGDKAEDVGEAVGDAAKEAGQTVEDGSITAAVKMKLANDETVSASKIDVDTQNGFVTLNGTVATQTAADRAVSLARTVDGVKDVRSNLIVETHQ